MTIHSSSDDGCRGGYASIYCKPWDFRYYRGLATAYAAHIAEENRRAKQEQKP